MPRRTDDQGRTVEVEYPNREKASSKSVKAVVVLLTLVTAGLLAIVTVGGWEALQGAKALQVAYVLLFLLIAFYIARWRSGLLPVVAALAMILLIFAAVSGPQWFARAKDGFSDPALPSEILGLITLIIIPVQVLLIGFAMAGFRQNWQTEVEHRVDDDRSDSRDRRGGGEPSPAPA